VALTSRWELLGRGAGLGGPDVVIGELGNGGLYKRVADGEYRERYIYKGVYIEYILYENKCQEGIHLWNTRLLGYRISSVPLPGPS